MDKLKTKQTILSIKKQQDKKVNGNINWMILSIFSNVPGIVVNAFMYYLI